MMSRSINSCQWSSHHKYTSPAKLMLQWQHMHQGTRVPATKFRDRQACNRACRYYAWKHKRQIHRPWIMNGGLSQLTIYGMPTGANKRKHKGQTFRKSDYFNAATSQILLVQAASHIRWAPQCKLSVLFGMNWWPLIADIDQHSGFLWAAPRSAQVQFPGLFVGWMAA